MAKLIIGINDLLTTHPSIAKQWNYEKNGCLKPNEVTAGSDKRVWWKCELGHEWEDRIANRKHARNCPYCSGHRIIVGFNDFATIHPEMAKEWNYLRNGDLKPTEVTVNSNKTVWWICSRGHEWRTAVYNRHKGRGCAICKKEYKTSFPEQSIFYYVKKSFPDAISGDTSALDGRELDVYIPSLTTAIEYDGFAWHNTKDSVDRDTSKCALCKMKGITIIRIRENGLESLSDSITFFCKKESDSSLESCIKQVLEFLRVKQFDVDLKRDRPEIYSSFISSVQEKNLAEQFPLLASEWSAERNGNLDPSNVTAKSGKRVWWICQKGHEWQATIASRSFKGNGCPYCSGRFAIPGQSDLKTVFPKLAAQWHPTKNKGLIPGNVTARSHSEVWWLYPYDDPQTGKHFNFEWKAAISNRNPEGTDCPFFNSKLVWPGFNDLASVFPQIASEWHPVKNGTLNPAVVSAKSGRKIWWICPQGHEYYASIDTRTHKKNNCPICSGHRVLAGYNDLATTHPKLAKEWHPTKNGQLKTSDVVSGCNKKVWWQCEKGHEWYAVINSRSNLGVGCPYCQGQRVLSGVNDLATVNPALASEWHPSRNGTLLPTEVKPYSGKRVWWKCKNNHEWEAKISNRSNGRGCPLCKRKMN